jgi:hypothetical protein
VKAEKESHSGLKTEDKKTKNKEEIFMKSVMLALLAMAASIGLLPAQTPFMIASVSSGQVLDVPGFSTTPGALIQQYPANGGTNQQWNIRHVPGAKPGVYEIASVSSGMVLDVPGLSTAPGTLIQQYPANFGPNQQWRFSRAPGSAGYEIISSDLEFINDGTPFGVYVNLVLDVPGFSTAPGALIQQYSENGGVNQQWVLYPLALKNITMGPGQGFGTFTIAGWGFQPGTQACPVINGVGAAPCATVLANGTFSTEYVSNCYNGYCYEGSGGPGYIVVTVEDKSGNVLAIGSVPGAFDYRTP